MVENALVYASDMCGRMEVPTARKGRRKCKKLMPGEKAVDVGLTLLEKLKRAMFECVDRFHTELHTRSPQTLEKVLSVFAVIQTDDLTDASKENIEESLLNLTQTFDET
ncbi:hypothetical protein PR048_033207 [Dryococelus australis]|uniref:Uncharacterized protein n=1 Tax=Dryococelus australis TaxID=614101 RepID=A0ABQ9FZL2_9NEOP|nr:hypothetical protein PR048_033207 [Dryococelus australis]